MLIQGEQHQGPRVSPYQRRRNAGLCVRCGQRALPSGRASSVKQAKAHALMPHNVAKGLTWQAIFYGVFCARHKEREEGFVESSKARAVLKAEMAKAQREQLEALVRQGLCVACCGPQDADRIGKQECAKCAAVRRHKTAERKRARVNAGLCSRCGKPNPTSPQFKTCGECRALQAAKMRNANQNRRRIEADRKARATDVG